MKKFYYIWVWILSMLLLGSCVTMDHEEEEEPVLLPIHLYVAMNESGQSSRTPGDPGVPQNYQLPRYLYVYFVQKLVGGAYNLDVMEENLDPKQWKEVSNPNTSGLYAYEGNLSMLLSKDNIQPTNLSNTETEESRVYAITSYDPLVFDQPRGVDGYKKVPDLQLDLNRNQDVDLLNVYANPLGEVSHSNGAVGKKGNFLYETKVTCYHVAARIDIQWDINPLKQSTFKMKSIELKNIPQMGYFFKHTANTTNPSKILRLDETNGLTPGNQWYGRHVFHAFDRNQVECTFTLVQNGGADVIKEQIYNSQNLGTGTQSSTYSSWYRISAAFGY